MHVTATKEYYLSQALQRLNELANKEENLSFTTLHEIGDFFKKLRATMASQLIDYIESQLKLLNVQEIRAKNDSVLTLNRGFLTPPVQRRSSSEQGSLQDPDIQYQLESTPHALNRARRSGGLLKKQLSSFRYSKQAIAILTQWWVDHQHDPYPTHEEKQFLVSKTKLRIEQVSYWFIYQRKKCRNRRQYPS